jgi:hypothetical protein
MAASALSINSRNYLGFPSYGLGISLAAWVAEIYAPSPSLSRFRLPFSLELPSKDSGLTFTNGVEWR